MGTLSSLITFQRAQREAPRSLRKALTGYKNGKRLGEALQLKGAEKEFTIASR